MICSRQMLLRVFLSILYLLIWSSSPANADGRVSGNQFLSKDLSHLAQDSSANPISLWLEQGQQIWSKDCQACHTDLQPIRGAVVEYPKWKNNRLMNLEDQILQCFTRKNLPNLGLESQEVIAIATFLSDSAKGLKILVKPPLNPPEQAAWQEALNHGANLYVLRQGRVNLSCTQCHDLNIGKNLRSDIISPAYVTGFPIYRQSWQTMGTMDRRLRACYSGVQAKVPASSHPDLRALELFLKKRSEGMAWEGPSMRR